MSDHKLPRVNLFDNDIQQCPYDAYQILRDEAPAYKCPKSGMYVISRYEDVKRVLTDHKNFTNRATIYGSDAQPGERERAIIALFEKDGWLPAEEHLHYDRVDPEHDRDWLTMLAADDLAMGHFMVLKGGNLPGVWAEQYAYGEEGQDGDENDFVTSWE